jgi:hypothetical protein
MDEGLRLGLQAYSGDDRTPERLVAHYRVEKELAAIENKTKSECDR